MTTLYLKRINPFILLFTIFLLLPLKAVALLSDDKGSRGYWLARYGEIRPESNPLSRRAHDVFRKVLKASDRRKGIDPELIIINYSGSPWAQSLVDGTIILTKNALEFSYRDGDLDAGDSRLAFVIGHELAHQFNGDFWHYLFFQATEAVGMEKTKAFYEIRDIVKSSENLLVKELQADQYGVIYASVAGYDVDSVVSRDKNLFEEWARAIDPSGFFKGTTKHPSPEQRAVAVIARLRDVSRRLSVFRAGVVSYYIGLYEESITMMEEFARLYPSKEVYNNIGTAYLSLAYKNYKNWKGNEAIPFRLSFGIDPYTHAESIEIGKIDPMKRELFFTRYITAIDKAEEYLRRAAESGYDYALSRNNLGCAYILQGRFHEAVAILDEALALKPDDKEMLNNRGVAYHYLAERLNAPQLKERAEVDFNKALSIDKDFSVASYNLAIIDKGTGIDGTILSRETIDARTTVVDLKRGWLPYGLRVGEPVPMDIKKAVKKGYFHKVTVDDKINMNILDLPERGLTIVERNGVVGIVILRNQVALKKVDSEIKKGWMPDKRLNYRDREIWLFPSQGIGIEFLGKKAVMGFIYLN